MKTVIVIDDEPITRMDLVEMLEDVDFQVIAQGSDGFDAVEQCRQHNPDLVLMDIKMPIFDGLSAADAIIREKLAGCVVLLTAFSDKEFIAKAKQIGVSGYLAKPVEERVLIPTLEIALAQSKRYEKAVVDCCEMRRQLEEKNLVDRAKIIVAKRDGISEGEAYAVMRKMSMDKRRSMREIAGMVVAGSGDRTAIDKAKQLLMERYGLEEEAAYQKIKEQSKACKCTVAQAAAEILKQLEDSESA